MPFRRPGLPQRGGEQGRRPVVEPTGQGGVEPLREAIEQVAHVFGRRPIRDGGAAERGQQERRLRRQRGVRRGARQRRFRRRRCRRQLPDLPPGMGQGEARLNRVGGERDGPLQRLQGRARVAERGQRLAQVAKGHGVLRPPPQRCPEEMHRAPQLARFGKRAAMVGEEHRRLGLEGEGPPRVLERPPRVAALPRHHAEQVVGVRLLRPGRRHPAVQAFSRGEIARPVAGHAFLQQRVGGLWRHAGTLCRGPFRSNIFTPHSRLRSCATVTLLPRIVFGSFRPPRRPGHWKRHAESTRAIIHG